jgi:DNA-binding CsgD family transcriptional regulator
MVDPVELHHTLTDSADAVRPVIRKIIDGNRRSPGDLERIADELLRAAGDLGGTSGIYTQAQLDRKIRNERERLPALEDLGLPQGTADSLVEQGIEELIDVSRLTVRQEIAFRLHVSGFSCRDIAATLNIQRNRAAALLGAAKRKVRAAYNEGRYAGWYEVYLSEVRRGRGHSRHPAALSPYSKKQRLLW